MTLVAAVSVLAVAGCGHQAAAPVVTSESLQHAVAAQLTSGKLTASVKCGPIPALHQGARTVCQAAVTDGSFDPVAERPFSVNITCSVEFQDAHGVFYATCTAPNGTNDVAISGKANTSHG